MLRLYVFVVLLGLSVLIPNVLARAPQPLLASSTRGVATDNTLCATAAQIEFDDTVTTIQGTLEGVPLQSNYFSYWQLWHSRSPALYYYFTGIQGRIRINSCNLLENSTTDIGVFVSADPWDPATDLETYCNDAYGLGSLRPLAGAQGPDKICTTTMGGDTSLPGGVDLQFCADAARLYLIRVEENTWPLGEFQFEINIVDDTEGANETGSCASPVQNLDCDNAVEIELGTPVNGNTGIVPLSRYFTTYSCVLDFAFSHDVWNPLWYTIIGNGRRFQITWPFYEYDVVVSIFSITSDPSSNTTEPCSDSNVVCVAGRDDTNSTAYQTAAELAWNTAEGAVYRIAVFGFDNQGGRFTFEVNDIGNNTCSDATGPTNVRRSEEETENDEEISLPYYL